MSDFPVRDLAACSAFGAANAVDSARGSPAAGAPLGVRSLAPGAAVAVTAILLAAAVARLLPHIRRHWKLRRIPTIPGKTHWLLGNLLEMLEPNHHLLFREGVEKVGGVFRLRLLTMQMVVVADARYVNTILGASEGLSKGIEPDNADRLTSVGGHRSMFSAATNSDHWRLIRKGTAGAFQARNIRKGFPEVLRMAQQLASNIGRLGPSAAFDVNNATMRYAMDVTGLVGFAKDFGTCRTFDDADTDELFDILRAAMLEVYRGAINPLRRYFFHLSEVRSSRALFAAFRRRMRELLEEVRARGPPAASDASVAAHLLRLRDPATGAPLADDVLAGEFGVYFTAGIESAGNAMSWTLFLICQRPDVEARICAELRSAGLLATSDEPQPRQMELADLAKLPYFCNTCKEAMRFKPVASTGSTRVTRRDIRLGAHTVPAGSLVLCPFDAVHHTALNWGDPDEFKPERWEAPGADFVPGTGKNGTNEGAAIVVGSDDILGLGLPAECIGQSLAVMMHDVGVAVLLSRFSFRLAPRMGGVEGVLATEINRLTLQPGAGLWMNATPRW